MIVGVGGTLPTVTGAVDVDVRPAGPVTVSLAANVLTVDAV